jgi:hypothetical protein
VLSLFLSKYSVVVVGDKPQIIKKLFPDLVDIFSFCIVEIFDEVLIKIDLLLAGVSYLPGSLNVGILNDMRHFLDFTVEFLRRK